MRVLNSGTHVHVDAGEKVTVKSNLHGTDTAIARLEVGDATNLAISGDSKDVLPVLVDLAKELHGLIIELAPDHAVDRLLRVVEQAHDACSCSENVLKSDCPEHGRLADEAVQA